MSLHANHLENKLFLRFLYKITTYSSVSTNKREIINITV